MSKLSGPIRGLVFDLDDVLIPESNERFHYQSWKEGLELTIRKASGEESFILASDIWENCKAQAFNKPEPVAIENMAAWIENNPSIKVNSLDRSELIEARLDSLSRIPVTTTSKDKIVAAILEFASGNQIPVGVCTSSGKHFTETIFNSFNYSPFIDSDAIICTDDPEIKQAFKPSVVPWKIAFDRLGINDGHEGSIIIVEDSPHNILPVVLEIPSVFAYLVAEDTEMASRYHDYFARSGAPLNRIKIVTHDLGSLFDDLKGVVNTH